MDAVILKGRADGFELQLQAAADFQEVLTGLDALLAHLYADTPTGNVDFVIESGKRLLTAEQRQAVEAAFDRYPRFSIRMVHSEVVEAASVAARVAKAKTTFIGGVIRSGQVVTAPGDVVFTGDLHKGGKVQAGGAVFVMGRAEGIVHAGYPQHDYAVVAGNLRHLQQIRIAESVEVVEDEDYTDAAVCYMNDQHLLTHGPLSALQELRPQIFEQMEES